MHIGSLGNDLQPADENAVMVQYFQLLVRAVANQIFHVTFHDSAKGYAFAVDYEPLLVDAHVGVVSVRISVDLVFLRFC